GGQGGFKSDDGGIERCMRPVTVVGEGEGVPEELVVQRVGLRTEALGRQLVEDGVLVGLLLGGDRQGGRHQQETGKQKSTGKGWASKHGDALGRRLKATPRRGVVGSLPVNQ